MTLPLSIRLCEPSDLVSVGEVIPLRFLVELDRNATFDVTIPAGGVRHPSAVVSTEMLLRDVTLSPGDSVSVTVGFRFDSAGPQNFNDFLVQVNPVGRPEGERELVRLPDNPFRVVPSLDAALSLDLTRICAYGNAVKVEVVVRNESATELTDVELRFGPADVVRAGPLVRRVARMPVGGHSDFDLIIKGSEVECLIAATLAGERVESRRVKSVPAESSSTAEATSHFRFLEPRAFTTDRVTLTAEGSSEGTTSANGIFPVTGGKSRYLLTIHPSHPEATSVRVYAAAGQVEIEAQAKSGREWPFLVTVVDNPLFTQLVRLDYDVQILGTPHRGEFHLSIRPNQPRAWGFAATLGAAVTVKGLAAFGTVLFRGEVGAEEAFESLPELMGRSWLDSIQLLSIPIARTVLWIGDRISRSLQEG